MKILQWVEDGLVLFYKRLERGTISLPSGETATSGSGLAMRPILPFCGYNNKYK